MNVAIFGGSFNPPHVAHVLACALVLVGRGRRSRPRRADVQAPLREGARAVRGSRAHVRARDGVAARRRGLARRGGARRREPHAAHARAPRAATPRLEPPPGHRRRSPRRGAAVARVRGDREAGAAHRPRARGRDATRTRRPPLLPAISSTEVRDAIARGAWARGRAMRVPRAVLAHIAREGSMARRVRPTMRCSSSAPARSGAALARALGARGVHDAARRAQGAAAADRRGRRRAGGARPGPRAARRADARRARSCRADGRRWSTSRARSAPSRSRRCAGRARASAQMHPMISFASPRTTPSLARGNVHVARRPVRRAGARAPRAACLGMTPRTFPALDTVGLPRGGGPRGQRRRRARGDRRASCSRGRACRSTRPRRCSARCCGAWRTTSRRSASPRRSRGRCAAATPRASRSTWRRCARSSRAPSRSTSRPPRRSSRSRARSATRRPRASTRSSGSSSKSRGGRGHAPSGPKWSHARQRHAA